MPKRYRIRGLSKATLAKIPRPQGKPQPVRTTKVIIDSRVAICAKCPHVLRNSESPTYYSGLYEHAGYKYAHCRDKNVKLHTIIEMYSIQCSKWNA